MLSPESRLGPYEIVSAIGAGGMGEVYRARDTKLDREVAVKVLPPAFAADEDAVARFEREAKAVAALSHPNILAIFDFGRDGETYYAVMELLEGESLRSRLAEGAISPRKAAEYASQVAEGLASAHAKGIVHRDLKPENLFLTRDGRVKILDFGLAKQAAPLDEGGEATRTRHTLPGTVMGTVGYMAPEQVRGEPADHRSDVFAFGAVLFEMLTGRRAFQAETAPETLTAILRQDPPEIGDPAVSPGLEQIVRHCLEKRPEDRFQSARDLAFNLSSLSQASAASRSGAVFPERQRPVFSWRLAAGLLLAAWVATLFLTLREEPRSGPSFQRVTFRPGTIYSARFTADEDSIVYGAAWEGRQPELFLTRTTSPESRPLGVVGSKLLAASSSDELAVMLGEHNFYGGVGTLAREPLSGGAPRELLEHVKLADWLPDASGLVVVRLQEGKEIVEFPLGTPVYESPGIRSLRVSRDGRSLALAEGVGAPPGLTKLLLLDPTGEARTLAAGWTSMGDLAFSPDGSEVWFTGEREDAPWGLHAVPLSGAAPRELLQVPGWIRLEDVAADGRVLLSHHSWRAGTACLRPGEDRERDLTWLDYSVAADLSSDGGLLLFSEPRRGGGPAGGAYLRSTDGEPAVRLADGDAEALSPDGRWAVVLRRGSPRERVLVPTGAGTPRTLPHHGLVHQLVADWHPDGRHILFTASRPDEGSRIYLQDVESGAIRPVSPSGVQHVWQSVSPDGQYVLGADDAGLHALPIDGGEPRPLPLPPGQTVPLSAGWSADNRAIYYIAAGTMPPEVHRLELSSGAVSRWRTLGLSDPSGIDTIAPLVLAADAGAYAYTYHRTLSDLYVVRGVE